MFHSIPEVVVSGSGSTLLDNAECIVVLPVGQVLLVDGFGVDNLDDALDVGEHDAVEWVSLGGKFDAVKLIDVEWMLLAVGGV